MGRLARMVPLALVVSASSCGSDSNPPQSPPGSGGGQTITGRERFGWSQTAPSPEYLEQYDYALYVDGARRVIDNETCTQTSDTSVDCSAPLPSLTPGRHTLELAAFVTVDGEVLEGDKADALQVTVAAATAGAGPSDLQNTTIVSSDGLHLQAEVLARDLVEPMDLAVAADGRVFVAEARGTVRIVSPAGSTANVLLDPAGGADTVLASIALAPDFADSGHVYVAVRRTDTEGTRLQIVRMRERGGALAERAVIAAYTVAAGASVVARFGPDNTLYVGVGAGAEDNAAQNVALLHGKVLRLQADGTTPPDNPWRSPVYSIGHRDPRGLAWHPTSGALLEVESGSNVEEMNAIASGGNYGWPNAGRAVRRGSAPALLLPAGTAASGIAVVVAAGSPLSGSVLVSSLGAEDLLRVTIDAEGRARVASRLLQQRLGRIAQVAVRDRDIFVLTANGDRQTVPDALVRLTPQN